MKKNILILFIIIIVILVFDFIFVNREITLKESSLKNIFTLNNFDNVEIFFIDILGNEQGNLINMDKKNAFLNSIKDEKIKPIIFENPDKIKSSNAYRMIIKYNNTTYRLIIFSDNTIIVNNKRYSTENNLYEIISSIFDNTSL